MIKFLIYFVILTNAILGFNCNSTYYINQKAQNTEDYVAGILFMIPCVLTMCILCTTIIYIIYKYFRKSRHTANIDNSQIYLL